MRILHTSDWHLGKKLEGFSRLEEQRQVLDEMCHIADEQTVDVVVIAGDLFDTFNPPSEAVELFYRTVKRLSNNGMRPVIAIAGNHDSPERIEAPDALARECGVILAGFPDFVVGDFQLDSGIRFRGETEGVLEVHLPNYSYPLRLLITPYANEVRLKTCLGFDSEAADLSDYLSHYWSDKTLQWNGESVNLLLTHLFMMKKGEAPQPEPDDERPILYVGGASPVYTSAVPASIQYVALGHLHRPHFVKQGETTVAYSGTPLAYGFGESEQDKSIYVVTLKPGENADVKQIPLDRGYPLLRRSFSELDVALMWLQQNQACYVELTFYSDTYMTADTRSHLLNAHPRIVTIIPMLNRQSEGAEHASQRELIDITKPIEELFADFFYYRKGQAPNERLKALFKELMGQD